MKFMRFAQDGRVGLAAAVKEEEFHGYFLADMPGLGDLNDALLAGDAAVAALGLQLLQGETVDFASCQQLPPLSWPGKIVCIGLNYLDHTSEAGLVQPDYPTIFSRFPSSLIGHRQPIVRPKVSQKLDYEGEIVIVIGRGGRAIPNSVARPCTSSRT